MRTRVQRPAGSHAPLDTRTADLLVHIEHTVRVARHLHSCTTPPANLRCVCMHSCYNPCSSRANRPHSDDCADHPPMPSMRVRQAAQERGRWHKYSAGVEWTHIIPAISQRRARRRPGLSRAASASHPSMGSPRSHAMPRAPRTLLSLLPRLRHFTLDAEHLASLPSLPARWLVPGRAHAPPVQRPATARARRSSISNQPQHT